MKALSIRQPWAWLICAGYKDIENRDWPTRFRGRIYVHASKTFDEKGYHWIIGNRYLPYEAQYAVINEYRLNKDILESSFGAIIGEVDIVNCIHTTDIGHAASKSPWFVGAYGFVLANPVLYEKPIPCKGRLGFFEPEILYITT